MTTKKTLNIPVSLIILDFLGTALLVLGLADWLADTGFVPESLRFENYPIALVIIGGLLILPLLLHIIKFAASQKQSG